MRVFANLSYQISGLYAMNEDDSLDILAGGINWGPFLVPWLGYSMYCSINTWLAARMSPHILVHHIMVIRLTRAATGRTFEGPGGRSCPSKAPGTLTAELELGLEPTCPLASGARERATPPLGACCSKRKRIGSCAVSIASSCALPWHSNTGIFVQVASNPRFVVLALSNSRV